ncbi:50S ribosomal protein L13 [endosymbiont of Pachyrhynchus infernalis]|uniref:50S ribosomal protein L13 n=1 Tax=endosymbiont of Pachyrhynchus infernalis TaxID=1971488 RepID=UPI000DC6FDF6|nr:50S ribosomal protein L13 [endosymbiont of Pachyrhynchus infernalis]BBA84916.1 50S ribosomal protein L13 [endosymbiont of Pachyrhynchus infernalis]
MLLNKKVIRKWYLLDAENKNLGRISTLISLILQGKNKSEYSSNIDVGDYIVLINAKKIKVTGNKFNNKIYYKHTGYIGNLKKYCFKDIMQKNPKYIIIHSIKGMLPKNKLQNIFIKKLKIFLDSNHTYKNIKFNILDIN